LLNKRTMQTQPVVPVPRRAVPILLCTVVGLVTACGKTNNPRNPSGQGPAAVSIGAASDHTAADSYAVLAKTAVTNVTASLITGGDVGLSPAAASYFAGLTLTPDATNTFATAPQVAAPGKIYASTYADPTPANLTAAVLSMQAAYTDAAGRTNTDFLNLGSGEIGGRTLTPGLYTWGSSVTISNDVTFSGGANDVWILQISQDLDLSTAKNVTLSGGALAKNIFWQVAGNVTVHASAHFAGIILAQTAITLQTTASLDGRALAQTLVAMDNNAITAP
jgi:hypothetical protein